MASLLTDEKILRYDIICLQELWRNAYVATTHNPIKRAFRLCYLMKEMFGDGSDEPRLCMFIHKRLDTGITE